MQQDIIWASVDPDQCHHIFIKHDLASLLSNIWLSYCHCANCWYSVVDKYGWVAKVYYVSSILWDFMQKKNYLIIWLSS